MSTRKYNVRTVALGGILAALAVVCLYLEAVAPVSKLSLYALSSFFISIIIIETGIRNGWIFYIATSLLSFLVVPDKLSVIPYVTFFGIYGIVKFYIEKLHKILPEYILKYLFFNAVMIAAVFFIENLVGLMPDIKLAWWVLVLIAEAVFFVYDYVYTRLISYYISHIRRRLNM